MSKGDIFSFQERMAEIRNHKDALTKINNSVDWEIFREILTPIFKKEKGKAGRPPYDVILQFKITVLQFLYGLSEESAEFQIKDRLSFMNFLGLNIDDKVPDENTIRNFRESLKEHKLTRKLFKKFICYISTAGITFKKGKIIDATFITVPIRRLSRDENQQIKDGIVPESIKKNPEKLAQTDTDATFTKKNDTTFFGYKDHILVDSKTKIIEEYIVTTASTHDSVPAPELIEKTHAGDVVSMDSAYNADPIEETANIKMVKIRVCGKGYRNNPLSEKGKKRNTIIAKVRSRVEHVFGDMTNIGLDKSGWIGMERNEVFIGLANLVYNFRRFSFLKG